MNKYVLLPFFCLMTFVACPADTFMAGRSRTEVEQELGHPLREIETGRGVLLFYGSVFLEMEQQSVVFINALSEDDLERRRLQDAERGIYWGPEMDPGLPSLGGPTAVSLREMSLEEQDEWLETKRRHRERTIETRVRRFLLTRTYAHLMKLRPLLARPSTSWRHRGTPAAESTALRDIKDSQGRRVPAIGEDRQYIERHLDFGEMFLSAPVLAHTQPR